MKNIHILPTEKPSRLHLIEDTLTITSEYENSVCDTEVNIYITNSEEIKDCYVLTDLDKIVKVDKSNQELYHQFNGKKIILTTDQDLINDGVQDIDDEFLLWFVSNPSCEWVETFIDTMGCTLENCDANPCINYKIIIPKEEPKETLEEAAEKYAKSNQYDLEYQDEGGYQGINIKSFVEKLVDFTTKWQQEQDKNKYSEDDMKQAFENGSWVTSWSDMGIEMKYDDFETWFKTYKKK